MYARLRKCWTHTLCYMRGSSCWRDKMHAKFTSSKDRLCIRIRGKSILELVKKEEATGVQ